MQKLQRRPILLPFLLYSFLGFAALGRPVPAPPEKLNVLLITIDTLRADRLSCYGSQNPKTPHIDELAKRGTLFAKAFANTPTTLPSHANIMLGNTPNFHGVHENLNFIVNRELLTLSEHLKSEGYTTGAFVGAYPLDSRFGLDQGFDIYDDDYSRNHTVNFVSLERNAEAVIGGGLEWLEDRTSPWFLWLHCWDPHAPYEPPGTFKTQYQDHPYAGEVAYVDSVLGQLFAQLEKNSLIDSTLIILTGDHGESLGQHGEKTHGFFAYNSTIWIPLIITLPGNSPARISQAVSHIDIFPTICDVLGIEKPTSLQGTSLLPALKGKKLPERRIYFESLYPYYSRGWAPLRGFVFEGKKFIDSPVPELYDLDGDFDELNNQIEKNQLGKLRSQLNSLVNELTPTSKVEAAQRADLETRKKLASLGYISSGLVSQKKKFSVQDDIKILLPCFNRADDAWELFLDGKQEEGITLLKEILAERNNIDLAYKHLAAIYQKTGNPEAAIQILENGLDALPLNYDIFIEYMKVLLSAQEYDKVISSFQNMRIREAKYDPAIWNNLGIAYEKSDRFEDAIQAFETGLALDSKLPELNNNLANVYFNYSLQSKDPSHFSRCFEYYKKAIELDPGYAAPYYGLGHAYKRTGNLEGAISCWVKALEMHQVFSAALFDLANLYLESGDKTTALALLSRFKKLNYNLISLEERKKLDALLEQSQK